MAGKDRLFMLLSELDENELANLWTQCLRMKPEDEFFDEGSHDHKVIVISKEWRAVHGHTLLNRFRNDHDLPWKRILIDVADKMKPGLRWTEFRIDDDHSEEEIETAILGFFDELVKLGLRIFRWTENMETAVPTDHPSDFLVYDADLLSWPVAF